MPEYVSATIEHIRTELRKIIVGQDEPIEQILVAMLAEGHALIEGVPGTAKTLTVKTLARIINAGFGRIQFTPDLMPSDITGTNVFNIATSSFNLRRGPVFTDILLADEINRTPPKTQAALLEAMEERQVTIDGEAYPLSPVFTVLATENPIEYEGTYPLPEAQLDRFLLKILLDYLWAPLFLGAYAYGGIYLATEVLIATMVAMVAIWWLWKRELNKTYAVVALITIVLGGITLYLRNPDFIKFKPTIIYLLFTGTLFGGLIFKKPLLAMVFDQVFHLTEEGWRKLTVRWALFFLLLAVLNEIVWRTQSTDTWVTFKVFGVMPLTFIFAAFQYPLLTKHDATPKDQAKS